MRYIPPEGIARPVAVEVTTSDYRVSGIVRTRFDRVASVLNNIDLSHLTLELATIRQLYDPGRGRRAELAMIPVDEILFLAAEMPEERTMDAIIVPKHPVKGRLGLPPFELEGTIFVADLVASVGTALTMTPDAFVPIVDVDVTCWIRAELNSSHSALAFQRRLVHVMSFEEDAPDPLAKLHTSVETPEESVETPEES